MNNHIQNEQNSFECVEPTLGKQLALISDPTLDDALKRDLEDHLTICDACRLEISITERIEQGLQSGDLKLRRGAQRPRIVRSPAAFTILSGGFAIAASLMLMFIVPPQAAGPDVHRRDGATPPHFVRPVEGEVIATSTPELEWSPIEGATAYQVQVTQLGGEEIWSDRIETTTARIPADAALDGNADYRALLEPIPADLADFADVSVTFQRRSTRSFLSYRTMAAPRYLWALGGLGALAMAWGIGEWSRRSR